MSSSQRSPELLSASRSRLLVIDMQEKLLPAMHDGALTTKKCAALIQGAGLFEIPVSATEQYPRGLGPTVPKLAELLDSPVEKVRFSSAESFDWSSELRPEDRDQIVLIGIEAHVCVLQTALDLISRGFQVYVVTDATTSRAEANKQQALKRITDAGGTLINTESVMFEWCVCASHPLFKQVSQIVKSLDPA
ncbi:MAG: isochorismatase family protein [Planctomycetaceae bacterium]|nr:isochorismatase family protein [Planctomycetaceae bacterium]